MICPKKNKTKIIAGTTRFTSLDLERPEINFVTSLLDDLEINPAEFLAELEDNLDVQAQDS